MAETTFPRADSECLEWLLINEAFFFFKAKAMVGVVAMKATVGLYCWKETSSGHLWLDRRPPEQP